MKILKIILFSPLAFIKLILVILISLYIVLIGFIKLKRKGYSRELQVWAMYNWGKLILWTLGVKAEIKNKPEIDKYIVMPNHRSYIDIPLIVKLHQGTLVGKAEVGKWPMARTAAKLTKPILVKRSEIRSLVETMKKIKKSVANNIPVILFPEGTTFVGPLTKPFKNGSFKIAAETRIPIIPVAIHYPDPEYSWVGKDTFFGHFFRKMWNMNIKVYVRYGTPVTNPDYKILKEETQKQIDNMLKEIIDELKK
ncbi:MAG: 1-acyl-sn-glycerol-3-phosphate acyltransferase [Prolixibacteraceae bacterium]|nr:1-acyl-sn-glycerol-3-phosphate acyltransferase [Prolixibacteraceae bacterium]